MDAITDDQIARAIEFYRKQYAENQTLLAEALKIRLRFCMFKLPVLPETCTNSKLVRIVLRHMLPSNDACLIVADGENREDRTKIDDTIQFYEDMFRKAGITEIKEVIPLLKMKLEYQTYESKRVLSTRYGTTLADAKIYRLLPALLGKNFYGKKRMPIQVELHQKGIVKRVKQALQTQLCQMSFRGTNSSVVVGQLEMSNKEIIENIQGAITRIVEVVPGGEQNIQSLSLMLDEHNPLPIYISKVDRSMVPIPELPLSFQSTGETLEDEVSTVKGKVTIAADGSVIITKADGGKEVIGAKNEKPVPKMNNLSRRIKKKRGKRGGTKNKLAGKLASSKEVQKSATKRTQKKSRRSRQTANRDSMEASGSVEADMSITASPTVKPDSKGQKRSADASQLSSPPKRPKPSIKVNDAQSMKAKTTVRSPKASAGSMETPQPTKKGDAKKSPSKVFSVVNKTPRKESNNVGKTPVASTIVSTPLKETPLKTPNAVSKKSGKKIKSMTTPLNAISVADMITNASGVAEKTPMKTPGTAKKSPMKTPGTTKKPSMKTPGTAKKTPMKTPGTTKKTATETPSPAKKTAMDTPSTTKKTSMKTPGSAKETPMKPPGTAKKTPMKASSVTNVTPMKMSSGGGETPLKVSSVAKKTPLKVSSAANKTPSQETASVLKSASKRSASKGKSSTKTPMKTPKKLKAA